jgi:lipoate-protein ligase A
MSLEFRVIGIETRDPYTIAAMDDAIQEAVAAGRSPPTLVFHDWKPSVSLATSQARTDLDLSACKRLGYDVIRLRSGGKAVVHSPGTEFTYSLFVPFGNGGLNTTGTYRTFCRRIGEALASFGLAPVIVRGNDIYVGERKVGGNALWVRNQTYMQQGFLLFDRPDTDRMLELMQEGMYPPSASGELRDIITAFSEHSDATQAELHHRLISHLTEENWKRGMLTEQEIQRMTDLLPNYHTVGENGMQESSGLCLLPAPHYVSRSQAPEVYHVA